MMKKYAPPPERDPVPAMFVGDEAPPPAPVVPAKWKEALATQPDDLQLVTRGQKLGVWVLISPIVFVSGLATVSTWPLLGAAMMGGAAVYALYGWGVHWHARNHLNQFRLTDEGIMLTVRHRWGGKPRETRIVWAEMRKYAQSEDANQAFLGVEDDFGNTIVLQDHPGRAGEFIRRFAEQARLHGIPSEALPSLSWVEDQSEAEKEDDDAKSTEVLGCLAWLVGVAAIGGVADGLGASEAVSVIASFGIPSLALYLWKTLHNVDVARGDRTSRKLMARLRRWLRTVLDIQVS